MISVDDMIASDQDQLVLEKNSSDHLERDDLIIPICGVILSRQSLHFSSLGCLRRICYH